MTNTEDTPTETGGRAEGAADGHQPPDAGTDATAIKKRGTISFAGETPEMFETLVWETLAASEFIEITRAGTDADLAIYEVFPQSYSRASSSGAGTGARGGAGVGGADGDGASTDEAGAEAEVEAEASTDILTQFVRYPGLNAPGATDLESESASDNGGDGCGSEDG